MLGPEGYGILGVVLTLIYLILVLHYVIQTSLSKFVASFHAKKDNASISNLFVRSTKKVILLGIILFVITLLLSWLLADFFRLPIGVVWIVALTIPFILLVPIARGMLQGIQNFKKLGINFITEAFAKFIFGLILVFLGFGIFGAVFGITAAYITSFILGYFVLKKYWKKTNRTVDSKEVYKYSWPVFVVLLTLTLFYSLDIMLVKHYFDAVQSGFYAAFAILGRIIFFASFSLVFVLFPKSVEAHALGKTNTKLLKKSLILVSIVSIAGLLVYLLLPKLVVLILFGSKYLEITKYVFPFGIIMMLFSFVYVLSFYNLSINRYKFIYALILLDISEIIFMILFHKNFYQIIFILGTLIFLALIFMLIYTFKKNGKVINSNSSI
ncbi:oligosaccharide flippase family protein [Candidatus Woesearchaeota archaeon]|nr:oligosaccharide flippase family protein [Candidatus Woesearchaeota archaeon]